MKEKTFDSWPQKYESWFSTPLGSLVLRYEFELVRSLASVAGGERILDAGCGTGIFTKIFHDAGGEVTGLDLSLPMLRFAAGKLPPVNFLQGSMLQLPFEDNAFDFSLSITALEFIKEGKTAVDELFRVTRPGGKILVATLNSLSPWADERKERGKREGGLYEKVYFRSPEDLQRMRPENARSATCIHFGKDEDPASAARIEEEAAADDPGTGAFAALLWVKDG